MTTIGVCSFEWRCLVLTPAALYPVVLEWLKALAVCAHATARASRASLVTALLVAQSLQPTALMRALPSPRPVPARQRYKRVARALERQWLAPAWLTAGLVRGVLALHQPAPLPGSLAGRTPLALDSLRCGPWEIFTVGVVWHGRVVPVRWAVLPYPWPKGPCTPTVCALLAQVAAVWPPDRPVEVADRAFASYACFATLRAARRSWTVRLQARPWITVNGPPQQARALRADARPGWWTSQSGAYGSGRRAVAGTLVVGRGPVVRPGHQRTAGSLAHRQRRLGRRRQHAASTNQRRTAEADAWVIRFSSHASPAVARTSYRQRWPTEGTYRDAQTGRDGQHGWDLPRLLRRATTPAAVERIVGLWALGTLAQTWVGLQARHTPDPAVQAQVAQWTTTGRLSVWAHGRLALTEPSGQLAGWLAQIRSAGAARLAAAPLPVRAPTALRRPRRPALLTAA